MKTRVMHRSRSLFSKDKEGQDSVKLNFSTSEGLTFFFFELTVFEAQECSTFLKELTIMLSMGKREIKI